MKAIERSLVIVILVVVACWIAPAFAQQSGAAPAIATNPPGAVPVQNVPSPASPDHAPEQVMWALIASYALQYLKNKEGFGLLSHDTAKRVQVMWGAAVAVITAAGVHFAVQGSMLDGHQGASITVTGLSFDALKDIAFQWASQQAWFDAIVNKRGPSTT